MGPVWRRDLSYAEPDENPCFVANYVVQKMLDVVDGEQKDLLLAKIRPHLQSLKKFSYGKHLISKVEKSVLLSSASGARYDQQDMYSGLGSF